MKEIKLIERPDLKSGVRNITEAGITAFMWATWIYLLLPLINIILWILGIRIFYVELIEKAGFSRIVNMFYNIGWIAAAIFISFWLWGYYNLKRYGKLKRRKNIEDRNDQKLLAALGITPEQHQHMRTQKEVDFKWYIDSIDIQEGDNKSN